MYSPYSSVSDDRSVPGLAGVTAAEVEAEEVEEADGAEAVAGCSVLVGWETPFLEVAVFGRAITSHIISRTSENSSVFFSAKIELRSCIQLKREDP